MDKELLDLTVINIATVRKTLAELRAEKVAIMERVVASKQYQDINAQIESNTALLLDLENSLDEYTLEAYAATGNKKPHPAVSIRLMTRLNYNPLSVLPWAKDHLPEAITLDKKLFEAHAKAVAKTQPVPGVEIVQEPSVTIASDLSEYLRADSGVHLPTSITSSLPADNG